MATAFAFTAWAPLLGREGVRMPVQNLEPVGKESPTESTAPAAPRPDRPAVFLILRDSTCSECGSAVVKNDFLSMSSGQPLCLACAGYADLEFLSAGDMALTRRASKYSAQTVVVVRFSRARKRYERQGILVEPQALEKAERECLDDAEERAAERVKAAEARRRQDRQFAQELLAQLLVLFPSCPPSDAASIAQHTAVRGSGRVGRTAAARRLEKGALTAAVVAAIRHNFTNYDTLLLGGFDRANARDEVAGDVRDILARWQAVR